MTFPIVTFFSVDPARMTDFFGFRRDALVDNLEESVRPSGKLFSVLLRDRESCLKFKPGVKLGIKLDIKLGIKLSIKLGKLSVHQRGRLAQVGESEGGDEKCESAHGKFCGL